MRTSEVRVPISVTLLVALGLAYLALAPTCGIQDAPEPSLGIVWAYALMLGAVGRYSWERSSMLGGCSVVLGALAFWRLLDDLRDPWLRAIVVGRSGVLYLVGTSAAVVACGVLHWLGYRARQRSVATKGTAGPSQPNAPEARGVSG